MEQSWGALRDELLFSEERGFISEAIVLNKAFVVGWYGRSAYVEEFGRMKVREEVGALSVYR
jgi:hypothetical protein